MSERLFARAYEVAFAALGQAPSDGLAHPFGLGVAEAPLTWRVSSDVWDAMEELARGHYGWSGQTFVGSARLLGFPFTKDERLPLNSMLLEPIDTK